MEKIGRPTGEPGPWLKLKHVVRVSQHSLRVTSVWLDMCQAPTVHHLVAVATCKTVCGALRRLTSTHSYSPVNCRSNTDRGLQDSGVAGVHWEAVGESSRGRQLVVLVAPAESAIWF